jgi:hypothetical protein
VQRARTSGALCFNGAQLDDVPSIPAVNGSSFSIVVSLTLASSSRGYVVSRSNGDLRFWSLYITSLRGQCCARSAGARG